MHPFLEQLKALPNGSRFFRCAFQVNTFDYVLRHKHPTAYKSEDEYNKAIIKACRDADIEVIAITDHYRIRGAESLANAARAAGIVVFPGFEAVTREGVHVLCLFDPAKTFDAVQSCISACGVHDDEEASPLGELSAGELLDNCPKWEMQCIVAHVASAGGLFRALQAGKARSAIWRHEELAACAIPGPVNDAPEDVRPILKNTDPAYHRDRHISVLNCGDVKSPDDVSRGGAWCMVKMTEPTIEGLRQAFLDPSSRIRLASDPGPEEHVEFIGMAWETEGFLRSCRIHFNENLNVLIGGRGSGKSTVIESLRYVLGLEPVGDDAKDIHNGIISGVLKSGTKISLLVQSYQPDRRRFLIERTVPDPPRVIDENGDVLKQKPIDIVRGTAVYGQNELAELARSPEKLTSLLYRFVAVDGAADERYQDLQEKLKESRQGILDCIGKATKVDEQLAALPALTETLNRYRAAGVEEKLKSRDVIVKAEAIISTAKQRLQPVRDARDGLLEAVDVDADFISEVALKELPAAELLKGLGATITRLKAAVEEAQKLLANALAVAESEIASVASAIDTEKKASQQAYEAALRDLQRDKIDGNEFIKLRQDIERLSPLQGQKAALETRQKAFEQRRRNDLAAWEDLKRETFQRLEKAAKKVSRELPDRLRVTVRYGADRTALLDLIKQRPGRFAEASAAIAKKEQLSLGALAEALRAGKEPLNKEFGIPTAQGEKLAAAGPELPMLVEELDLPHVTEIELNVGAERAPPEWRKLGDLSTGQKATALLYLLLLDAEAPLVLDQPEDNLDNRFISEGIVPRIRAEKRRRQFIFSSHNANIPVLGDAELIIGMRAVGEAGDGHADVPPEHMGSIDKKSVAALAEEILEGGKEAFMQRRKKYNF
ncbi:MAG: phosphoesterase [Alphaproteobacteria bacterium]|nr:phosphoesterase [Alphaproteobacteria bacterium]